MPSQLPDKQQLKIYKQKTSTYPEDYSKFSLAEFQATFRLTNRNSAGNTGFGMMKRPPNKSGLHRKRGREGQSGDGAPNDS